jgi:hypothetical protein
MPSSPVVTQSSLPEMDPANYHFDGVKGGARNRINIPGNIRLLLLKDSCGCAMGARFMSVGLLISISYYGWIYHQHAIAGFTAFWHGFVLVFIMSGLGKLTGLLLYRIVVNEVRNAQGKI